MLLSSLQMSAPSSAAPQIVRESLIARRVNFLSSSFGFFRFGSPRSLVAISESRTRTYSRSYDKVVYINLQTLEAFKFFVTCYKCRVIISRLEKKRHHEVFTTEKAKIRSRCLYCTRFRVTATGSCFKILTRVYMQI